MKIVFGLLLAGSLCVASCSKKSRPSASARPTAKTVDTRAATRNTTVDPPAANNLPPDLPAASPAPMAMAPMIVIDEQGAIITSRDKLPADMSGKVDYPRIARGYTQAQRQNLIYRFKMVPPRVLFVPDHLASKSAKGTYIIFKKKFWYWKKPDGLFHVDETYYQ